MASMCVLHTHFKKNPVPCYVAGVFIHYTNFWCTVFHDLTTKLVGMSAQEFEALPDDTAKSCALGISVVPS